MPTVPRSGPTACACSPRSGARSMRSRISLGSRARLVMTKWVYTFGDGVAEGRADMRNLLGGKGAGLAEMSNLGLPVPPGITITTELCTYFYDHDKTYPAEL